MAFTQNPYASSTEVKDFGDFRTDAQDTVISKMIAQAQSEIDTYLGYQYQTDGTHDSPATRTYDGNGNKQLLIERTQEIVTVQTVSYSITSDEDGNLTRTQNPAIDITADVFLGPGNLTPGFLLARYSGEYFPFGKRNIIVQGVFGAGFPPPNDIKEAAILLTIHHLKRMDNSYQDKVGSTESGTLIFRQNMPTSVKEILDRHRRRFFRTLKGGSTMPINFGMTLPKADSLEMKEVINNLRAQAKQIGQQVQYRIIARYRNAVGQYSTGAIGEDVEFKAYTAPVSGNRNVQLVRWYSGTENQIQEWKRVYVDYQEGPPLGKITYTTGMHQFYAKVETDDSPLIESWAEAAAEGGVGNMISKVQFTEV